MSVGRMPMPDEDPLPITPDMLLSRRVDFERRMRRLPPLTLWLAAVLVLVFLVQVSADGLDSVEAIVAMGALDADAIYAGQYWRLVSAIFLHGGVDHLLSNTVALFILGMVCEHAYGRAQFIVLYLVAGVAGSILSLLSGAGPSVGASGAIFGLAGAAIVLFRRHRDRLLMRDRRIGVVLLVWVIYSIAAGIATPYIDNGAHIGGAVGGALFARRLHPSVLEPMPAAHRVRVRRWLWVAGLAILYTGLGWIFR
jgi:rhomboid protease GluP